jgi:hypothetical protein
VQRLSLSSRLSRSALLLGAGALIAGAAWSGCAAPTGGPGSEPAAGPAGKADGKPGDSDVCSLDGVRTVARVPVARASYDERTEARLAVYGDYAIVVAGDSRTYDLSGELSNETQPISSLPIEEELFGSYIHEDRIYVLNDQKVRIIEVEDRGALAERGSIPAEAISIAATANRLFVDSEDGIQVWNVEDPVEPFLEETLPVALKDEDSPLCEGYVTGMATVEDALVAYVTYFDCDHGSGGRIDVMPFDDDGVLRFSEPSSFEGTPGLTDPWMRASGGRVYVRATDFGSGPLYEVGKADGAWYAYTVASRLDEVQAASRYEGYLYSVHPKGTIRRYDSLRDWVFGDPMEPLEELSWNVGTAHISGLGSGYTFPVDLIIDHNRALMLSNGDDDEDSYLAIGELCTAAPEAL